MYARYTSTRMRGSSVVQGLKSLASKLHPQLPLSPKESQRLLGALTSSFRQHLDDAHPQRVASDEARPKPSNDGRLKTGTEHSHSSSAALADKHLASVLTNPLLATQDGVKKPVLDYATAKVELQKNPGKDPVTLLEEYHEKGAATLPIAALCLETFQQSLDNQPKDAAQQSIETTGAGRRVLRWLWDTRMVETDEFVDNHRLFSLVVHFMILEGNEEFLWQWFKMDLTLGRHVEKDQHRHSMIKNHRWRGNMLWYIVKTKLNIGPSNSIDPALQAYFKACEYKASMPPGPAESPGSRSTLSVAVAGSRLMQFVRHHPERVMETDTSLFDQFIDYVRYTAGDRVVAFDRAQLHLLHPHKPTPLPALAVLKGVFASEPDESGKLLHAYYTKHSEKTRFALYLTMARTAAQSQDHALTEDANWVIDEIWRNFPEYADRYLEKDLIRFRRPRRSSERSEEKAHTVPERMQFPSFA